MLTQLIYTKDRNTRGILSLEIRSTTCIINSEDYSVHLLVTSYNPHIDEAMLEVCRVHMCRGSTCVQGFHVCAGVHMCAGVPRVCRGPHVCRGSTCVQGSTCMQGGSTCVQGVHMCMGGPHVYGGSYMCTCCFIWLPICTGTMHSLPSLPSSPLPSQSTCCSYLQSLTRHHQVVSWSPRRRR